MEGSGPFFAGARSSRARASSWLRGFAWTKSRSAPGRQRPAGGRRARLSRWGRGGRFRRPVV